MGVYPLAGKSTWQTTPPRRKIAVSLFMAFLFFEYMVYSIYMATRYQFDSPATLSFNHAIVDYYALTDMLIPNQITMYQFIDELPLAFKISLMGLLNLAVWFVMYVLIIRKQWRARLVIPGYFVLSLAFWVVALIV
jgi:hypothetical protein